MDEASRRAHWNAAYTSRPTSSVSWYQSSSTISRQLIHAAGVDPADRLVDVGGGASVLVDELIDCGFQAISVLDVSQSGLTAAQRRLAHRARNVEWIVGDVTRWRPARPYDLWHDRAVFHFMAHESDRDAYRTALSHGVVTGGHVILGTFAGDGPDRCSDLPVRRYDVEGLAAELGSGFALLRSAEERHHTPGGAIQPFTWGLFRRV